MAIKTKFLETDRDTLFDQVLQIQINIDDLINEFLEENTDLEVIDIKYQSNVSNGNYNDSALIIYKEVE